MFVVFDLDGTLALTEHRSHFLTERTPKDWRGFYAACDQDEPNKPLINLANVLYEENHLVEIWTGRSDEVELKTLRWMAENGLVGIPIRMRKEGDHRADTVIKAEWLDSLDSPPDLVFEDRDSMVSLYRARGIICCQVAPGAF